MLPSRANLTTKTVEKIPQAVQKPKQSNNRKSIGVKTCGDCGAAQSSLPQIRCDGCKKTFHALWKRVSERTCRQLKREKTPWLCDKCDADGDEDGDREQDNETDGDNNEVYSTLTRISNLYTYRVVGIKKQLKELNIRGLFCWHCRQNCL